MTERARKVLAEALELSEDERADLATELLATLPAGELPPDWAGELERRARRAHAEPEAGEPWELAEHRLRHRPRS